MTLRPVMMLLCLVLAACAPAHPHAATPPALLVVENGVLVDGSGRAPVPRARVVVRHGLVGAAGPMDEVAAPEGATVLDAAGGTILPGLVDVHAHHADPSVRRELLERGVTLVCDVGSPWSELPGMQRDARPGLPVARALSRVAYAGPVLARPGGYPGPVHGQDYVLEAEGPEAMAAAVRRLHAAGATLLKLALEPGRDGQEFPVPGPEELRAAVDAAHALGMTVRAHVEDAALLQAALDARVDVVDHAPVPRAPGVPAVADAQLARMAEQGVILVPTLVAGVRATWDNAPLLDVVARFAALGGAVAAGTDAPFAGLRHGALSQEMDLLSRAGLSPMQVLLAATANAARACGRPERGRIAPGLPADLVVVSVDALADPALAARPRWVVLDGMVVGGVVAKTSECVHNGGPSPRAPQAETARPPRGRE